MRTIVWAALALGVLWPTVAGGQPDALDRARERGYLVWGADSEGGAPYIFADPSDPATVIGFEVDIARELGRELGLRLEFRESNWESIYQDLARNAIDLGMNGLEVTEETRRAVAFSRPYYLFSEQLVVRASDTEVSSLADLRGRPVGTLEGTLAERILQKSGVEVRSYEGQVEPYDDCELGRIDGVLLDLPITKYYASRKDRPALRWAGEPIGRGEYAIAVAPGEKRLLAAIDQALARLIADGRLATILRRWGLWNGAQWGLVQPEEAGPLRGLIETAHRTTPVSDQATPAQAVPRPPRLERMLGYGSLLVQAALLTVAISALAMALAIGLGMLLAIGRLYGPLPLRLACIAFIELFRGTPVMLQLFVIYYGLPHLGLELSALTAAVIGLGLNYAAYEAEIYRAGLQAVPRGQMEAARSLGMTRWQAVRKVILPQAVRLVVPPVTNDFVSLFKDTSIVSVIAVQELTKRFFILARSDVELFMQLAVVTAVLYLLMSYPLSVWSRRLEVDLGSR